MGEIFSVVLLHVYFIIYGRKRDFQNLALLEILTEMGSMNVQGSVSILAIIRRYQLKIVINNVLIPQAYIVR